jgi:hypothetical protein
MNRFALMALIAVFAAAPAVAQQAPPPPPGPAGAPPPDAQQHMQTARDAARTQATAALSSDHQAKVNAVLARVKAGQLTDAHDAARAIDAILTPKESQAVLAARDKMVADMRADSGGPGGGPGAAEDSGPPPGGGPEPGGGGPGGGFGMGGGRHRGGGRAKRNDAGFALLMFNLDRDQMRALFADARPPR